MHRVFASALVLGLLSFACGGVEEEGGEQLEQELTSQEGSAVGGCTILSVSCGVNERLVVDFMSNTDYCSYATPFGAGFKPAQCPSSHPNLIVHPGTDTCCSNGCCTY
ncbi:MAG: hypothetical protein JXB05_17220 [Myxococcaceae bacterium]|nr:hypothetical protein [Myxococcaceae bacterium]